jgi:hypothetical protein
VLEGRSYFPDGVAKTHSKDQPTINILINDFDKFVSYSHKEIMSHIFLP